MRKKMRSISSFMSIALTIIIVFAGCISPGQTEIYNNLEQPNESTEQIVEIKANKSDELGQAIELPEETQYSEYNEPNQNREYIQFSHAVEILEAPDQNNYTILGEWKICGYVNSTDTPEFDTIRIDQAGVSFGEYFVDWYCELSDFPISSIGAITKNENVHNIFINSGIDHVLYYFVYDDVDDPSVHILEINKDMIFVKINKSNLDIGSLLWAVREKEAEESLKYTGKYEVVDYFVEGDEIDNLDIIYGDIVTVDKKGYGNSLAYLSWDDTDSYYTTLHSHDYDNSLRHDFSPFFEESNLKIEKGKFDCFSFQYDYLLYLNEDEDIFSFFQQFPYYGFIVLDDDYILLDCRYGVALAKRI